MQESLRVLALRNLKSTLERAWKPAGRSICPIPWLQIHLDIEMEKSCRKKIALWSSFPEEIQPCSPPLERLAAVCLGMQAVKCSENTAALQETWTELSAPEMEP